MCSRTESIGSSSAPISYIAKFLAACILCNRRDFKVSYYLSSCTCNENLFLLKDFLSFLFILYSKNYRAKLLATQSIEARAQQEGCRQACTIGLSINEDTKLEKGKGKKGSAARSFMRSLSHMSSCDCVYHNVYHNLLFSTSAVTKA